MKVDVVIPSGERVPFELGEIVGTGRTGDVHRVIGADGLCVKVFHEPRPDDLATTIKALIDVPPSDWFISTERHSEVAWPVGICRSHAGEVLGYAMLFVGGEQYLSCEQLFDRSVRSRNLKLTWAFHLAVATDLARLTAKFHARGIVIGDLAFPNIRVTRTGRITLLDCDSFSLPALRNSTLHRTWRPENGAPEIADTTAPRRTIEADQFALAVVATQLLLERFHPFAGVDLTAPEADRDEAGNIQRGKSWLIGSDDIRTTNSFPDVNVAPERIAFLWWAAFSPTGLWEPTSRPSAEEWHGALLKTCLELRRCRQVPQHVYHRSSTCCPWCERGIALGQDPFTGEEPPTSSLKVTFENTHPPVLTGLWVDPNVS